MAHENSANPDRIPRAPMLWQALVPLAFLVIALALAIKLYGEDAVGGPVQVALLLAAALAAQVGYFNGHSIADLTKAAVDSVGSAMGAIFILFSVGALIGTWNMSGTIATLTDWGIRLLNPGIFYVVATILCAVIALSVGSSWTVMGTIGVALVAVSGGLGLNMAIAAGAVISGAYFGDKMSPLSETTNLAAAVAGTDLYRHIRSMMVTTVPAILIALVIYLILGLSAKPSGGIEVPAELRDIEKLFHVSALTLIPLVVVIVLALRKIPPTLAILAGALTGGLVAIIFQPNAVRAFVGDDSLGTPWVMLKGVWDAMATGFVANTGSAPVDDLLSGGGMQGMLNTVWLIITALAFGGIMNHTGFLGKLIEPLSRRATSPRGAMASTGVTAIGINGVAGDQYLALVLTGNVFKEEFRRRGIAPQALSRQIEDTATVTSPLVPWNSCGAYASGVLGITTIAYLPFAFFNWINPLISFLYAGLGIAIPKAAPGVESPPTPEEATFYGVPGQNVDEVPRDGSRL
ncbi:Na+/H+ antiporter NhaC [Mycolicibacterium sp.]|uniref:Na+/H+ antiporter NhaC n=1 Tax=Mycolicibacterium sp. TaxID=2320850 RepID=UPI0025FE22C1|nr:Na+/H+ antiporter NhaC [Mycolicibacterium sp.]MCB9409505.1 Na+/H+ antiporter NhaC [Mycolicibacterium sp.]